MKNYITAGIITILGVGAVLGATVPIKTVREEETFAQCRGATINLEYRAYLLGRNEVTVGVQHNQLPEGVEVDLLHDGTRFYLDGAKNDYLNAIFKKDSNDQQSLEAVAKTAYGAWAKDNSTLDDGIKNWKNLGNTEKEDLIKGVLKSVEPYAAELDLCNAAIEKAANGLVSKYSR